MINFFFFLAGIVVYYPAPRSFTGEECAEFMVHGGRAVVSSVLDALGGLEGFRQAEPGEFVKRAFMNGKMDLTEVEGLHDLLEAETDVQRRLAISQMGGGLSKLYEGWRGDLIKALAYIEAVIDFGDDEDDVDDVKVYGGAVDRVRKLRESIMQHIDDGNKGEILRNGIKVTLIGPPNAGKSTILNSLARRDVAIVSPIAGTTRDIIEVSLNLGGYHVIVSDTAGLRETSDAIEAMGVQRAQDRAASSNISVVVVDKATLMSDSNELIPPQLIISKAVEGNKNKFLVVNKNDILLDSMGPQNVMDRSIKFAKTVGIEDPSKILVISCTTGEGVDRMIEVLSREVSKHFAMTDTSHAPLITRSRHRHNLIRCVEALDRFLNNPMNVDLAAEDLRQATISLGRITGRVDVEELLDVIFRDFCIGK